MASAAKREAAAEAAHAEAVADANGARIGRRPLHRPIGVHLTPYAPLCERLPIDDARRWKTFWGKSPDQVVRSTLHRVRLLPGVARVAAERNGDVDLMGPVPAELVKLVSGDPQFVPFAIFWEGVTAAELQGVLDALAASGWRPASVGEAH